jgi:GNAT superfamily N-acetyltransferase/ketosteroid isomerase-like protein
MSRENIEVVREIWRAFERFEFPADAFDEDVEWHTAADLPDRETCRGRAAVQRMLAAGWETVVDPGCQADELIDAGERIVVGWRGWGRGRASGIPIDWHEAHVYSVRGGVVAEVREYRTWREALLAAGLSEAAISEEPRAADHSDLDGLVATLTAAFETDPLWSWAFPDPGDLAVWWRFYIGSALRYRWVWSSGEFAAASVWIPPDGTELTDEEEERVEPLLRDLIGPRSDQVLELLESFEAAHPRERPHYYLSLLGTHPDRRGHGLGMALLARNLERIDAEGVPAYLESSNPANNSRYERLGFRQVGQFTTPDGSRTVATMWREAQP